MAAAQAAGSVESQGNRGAASGAGAGEAHAVSSPEQASVPPLHDHWQVSPLGRSLDPSQRLAVFKAMVPAPVSPVLQAARWPALAVSPLLPRGESAGPALRPLAAAWCQAAALAGKQGAFAAARRAGGPSRQLAWSASSSRDLVLGQFKADLALAGALADSVRSRCVAAPSGSAALVPPSAVSSGRWVQTDVVLGLEKVRRAVGRVRAQVVARRASSSTAILAALDEIEGATGCSAGAAGALLNADRRGGDRVLGQGRHAWLRELPAEEPQVWESEGLAGVIRGQAGLAASLRPSRRGLSCEVAASVRQALSAALQAARGEGQDEGVSDAVPLLEQLV